MADTIADERIIEGLEKKVKKLQKKIKDLEADNVRIIEIIKK